MISEQRPFRWFFRFGRIMVAIFKMRWHIPEQVGWFFIVVGLIHFIIVGAATIAIIHLKLYHYEIYSSLSLDKTQLVPMLIGLVICDTVAIIWGFIIAFKAVREDNKLDNSDKHSYT